MGTSAPIKRTIEEGRPAPVIRPQEIPVPSTSEPIVIPVQPKEPVHV